MGTKSTKGKSVAPTKSDNGGGKLANQMPHSSSDNESSSSADEVDDDNREFIEQRRSTCLAESEMTLEIYHASMCQHNRAQIHEI